MTRRIIAVVAAAFLANALGAVWYMVFQQPWMAASGVTMEQAQASSPIMIFLVPLVAWLVASASLMVLFARQSQQSVVANVQTVGLVWLAGTLSATILSVYFGGRGAALLWIDGGYLLAGLIVIAVLQALIGKKTA